MHFGLDFPGDAGCRNLVDVVPAACAEADQRGVNGGTPGQTPWAGRSGRFFNAYNQTLSQYL